MPAASVSRRYRVMMGAVVSAAVGLAVAVSSTAAAAIPTSSSSSASTHQTQRLCSAPKKGYAACMAIRQVNPNEPAGIAPGSVSPDVTPSGYGPSSLQSAYALPSGTAGSGQTVAIVDAYDDPNAESDLAAYRSQYGLPACTTANGCFRKANQNGAGSPLPSGNTGWAGEISLDVDMVSAVCPNCHILLVEASSAYLTDLGTAVNTAVSLGAKFVSNSYGAPENGTENSSDSSYFHHPGVAITASTGDSDYDGGSYPATSAYVTAVGGTSLRTASNSRGWTETVWNSISYTEGTGSGCSQDVAKPAFQSGINTGCSRRAEADVSAVADPDTGVAVYQTYGGSGWMIYGGTSAASPIVASVYALAGTPGTSDTPNSYPYAHTGNLNDVTSGSNGSCGAPLCTAGTGWDGPTGLGTPNGVAAFAPGSGGGTGSCGEASCTPVQAAYISHYTGAGCTGTESYYTPYFGYDGIRRSWDGHGMAGTILRTVTNRSYRSSDGVCHDAWPSGNTLSDFVTIYRCGEASCTPVQAAYISHYTGAGCTGTESYYTPYFGYDGIRRSWDGLGMAGTILRTVTNRSYRSSDGVCHDAWPSGNTLSDFVTIYR
jgi:hypothetical protein